MGMLYYGQNFLIYHIAFPAGARESGLPLPTLAAGTEYTLLSSPLFLGAAFCFPHSVVLCYEQRSRAHSDRLFHPIHRPRTDDPRRRQDQGVLAAAADCAEHGRDAGRVGQGGTSNSLGFGVLITRFATFSLWLRDDRMAYLQLPQPYRTTLAPCRLTYRVLTLPPMHPTPCRQQLAAIQTPRLKQQPSCILDVDDAGVRHVVGLALLMQAGCPPGARLRRQATLC